MRLEQAHETTSKADAERLRLQSQLKPVPTKLMRPSITSKVPSFSSLNFTTLASYCDFKSDS